MITDKVIAIIEACVHVILHKHKLYPMEAFHLVNFAPSAMA